MTSKIEKGNRFGRLTVVRAEHNKRVLCQCTCGNEIVTRTTNLRSGITQSCGCLKLEGMKARFTKCIIGKRFGRLVVTAQAESKNQVTRWLCDCDCGKKDHNVSRVALRQGVKSCGCYLKSVAGKQSYRHGYCGTHKYIMYRGAKARSKKGGYPFTIELTDIPDVPATCALLGIPLERSKDTKRAQDTSPSLDRIVPSLGYVPGNIQIISHRANSIKNNATFEEFEKIYLAWKAQLANDNQP